MRRVRREYLILAVFGLSGLILAPVARADEPHGSAFDYQGRVTKDGALLDGAADFKFTLWDKAAGGNMVGSTVSIDNVPVVQGLFNVSLDFGVAGLAGGARWLETQVRSPSGSGDFATLTPRQRIRPAPHSVTTRGIRVDDDGNIEIRGDVRSQAMVFAHGYASDSPFTMSTTDDATGDVTERAYISDVTGHFGIGNSAPSARLHVTDSAVGTSGLLNAEDAIIEDTVAFLGLYSDTGAGGSIGSGISLGAIGASSDKWSLYREPAYGGDLFIRFGPGADPGTQWNMFQIDGAGGDTYLVPQDGFVGIHELDPMEKLHVTGSATAADFALLTGWQEDVLVEDESAWAGFYSSDEGLGAGVTFTQVPANYPNNPADKWGIFRRYTGAQSVLDVTWDDDVDPTGPADSLRLEIAATGTTRLAPAAGDVSVGPLPGAAQARLHAYIESSHVKEPVAIFQKYRTGAGATNYSLQLGGSVLDAVNMDEGDDPTLFLNRWHNGNVSIAYGDAGNGGNVGVGITVPTEKLHVYKESSDGTENVAVFEKKGSTDYAVAIGGHRIDAINMGSGEDPALLLNYYPSGDVLIARGGGNVGIGTDSPDKRLHLFEENEDYVLPTPLRVESRSTPSSFDFHAAMDVSGGGIDTYDLKNGGGYSLSLNHWSDGDVQMVRGGGSVGVGTAPSTKLHIENDSVSGAVNSLATFEDDLLVVDSLPWLSLYGDDVGNVAAGITFAEVGDSATHKWAIYSRTAGNVGDLVITYGDDENPTTNEVMLKVNPDGRTIVRVLEITGADVAERFPVSDKVEPGMVVEIDPDHPGTLRLARGAYNRRVAGVVSGAGDLSVGAILGTMPGLEDAPPIALSGRVWVHADATTAAIEPGDLLTTADTPGHAMKATDRDRSHGAIIGKAMTELRLGERGVVLVLVNLQ